MSIQAVQSSIGNGFKAAANTFVASVNWAGHKVTTHVVPAIQKLWALTQSAARTALQLAKAGPVWPFAIAATLFAAGIASFGCTPDEEEEEGPTSCASTAWKIAGATAFLGSAACLGVGIAALIV